MSGGPNRGLRKNLSTGTGRRVGLARALSKLGFCSRSQAVEQIQQGNVKLNGAVRRNPETPVRLGKDKIEIAGVAISAAARRYLMLNKPRGLVTTADDERGRATIYDCLPESGRSASAIPAKSDWLAPVGRLDKASEGLLLLTNDSEWAARITAPETHLDKTYHVQIAAVATSALLKTLEAGVNNDGELLRAKRSSLLRHGEKHSWLEIVLGEGKNRHIRRMLAHLGIEVLRLIRVAIGPLTLNDLPKGSSRPLSPAEKSHLDQAIKRNSR